MASGMRALVLTCMVLAPWLGAGSAAGFRGDARLVARASPGRHLAGFFGNYFQATRARRALPSADEPDDSPVPAGGDASVTLKRIDLTGNLISEIEDGAFAKLPLLEELSLADNRLVRLPALPAKLMSFNANNNLLKTKGVKATAFKKLTRLVNLYLADNEMEAVPQIPEMVRTLHLQNNNITDVNVNTFCRANDTYYLRPSLSEVRLDGNPVVLSKYPDSFTCMKVLPIGRYR
ncbi:osteoglycin, paralog a isoform X2 [Phyllopteryx taeniolatus]|uniref:osteoglycin, paralog a isoform X2 n=1 Tax=Phyllopteryx taeniolatus TaxID=161469 RepID=UPI002AD2A6AC|nr:osteoglycin, paralog a isoform X2 [Phyllopteryx taeniolatus]